MESARINVISLFSGVGMLDMAVKLAIPGSRAVCYVEREIGAAAILAARIEDRSLDDAPIWSDIRSFRGEPWRGRVGGIIGGFPCTDLSVAGRQDGIHGAHSGLFFEYVRIIREIQPGWVFIENVPPVLSFPSGGTVLGELAALGFNAEWGTIRASDVGAPHKRDRAFILAWRPGFTGWRHLAKSAQRGFRGVRESSRGDETLADPRRERDERWGVGRHVVCQTSTAEVEWIQRQRSRDTANDRVPELADTKRQPGGAEHVEDAGGWPNSKADHRAMLGEIGDELREWGGWANRARASVDDIERVVANAGCAGEWRAQESPSVDWTGPSSHDRGAGGTVGDAASSRFERREPGESGPLRDGTRREEPGGRCDDLDDAGCPEWRPDAQPGSGGGERPDGWREEAGGVRESGPPLFPPGPGDAEAWRTILAERPDFAPAVESTVRKLADVDAPRVDQLRASGNGVVAIQGAAAFILLARRAGLI